MAVPALGILLLAIAVFALTNVDTLEQWGGDLAERFRGGLSLPLTILVVFLAGVLTSLTPCVYPVIPLAVTYLGARSASSRLRAFSLAAAYVAGMVACYTALGAAAGLTGTTFGAATQKWWVYAGVATIVLVFGLSMLGLFTLSLPPFLQKIVGRSRGPGYRGAVLMGATSGLVTAPCTAPVLGALILPMISGQSVALGSLLLAVFGLGMGMLFLVVGTYSGVLSSLPRSGRWMNTVKVVLGIAILGVAAFFFYKAWEMLPFRAAAPARTESRQEPRVVLAGSGALEAERPPARRAPAFEIVDVRGGRHTLESYRGRILHLVFFAVWCPPCLEEMGRLEVADARLRSTGHRILAVGMKEREDEESLRRYAEKNTLAFPIAWDAGAELARGFGVSSIPQHVLVGPDGTILFEGRTLPEGFERDGAGLLPGKAP